MFLMMIFWLLIIIGVILLIIWLVKAALSGTPSEKKVEEDPAEILKMRLAKGEIDEETYNRLLKKLK